MPLINQDLYRTTPKEVVSWRVISYAAALSFSGALHGFNTANISGVLAMSSFKKHFGLSSLSTESSANWTGWITSILILGSMTGSILAPFLMDRTGRRSSLAIYTSLYIASAILMAANPGGEGGRAEFMVGRVLSGVGSGAASVIGTGYIAEISPKAIRGGLTALYNASTMLCVGLAYWVNYGSLLNTPFTSNVQWEIPMAVQALPGVILLIGLIFVPESPRWLATHGRLVEAQKSLEKLRCLPIDHPYLAEEYAGISAAIEEERAVSPGIKGMAREIMTPNVRKRLIMVLIVQVGFQLSGGNIITYYNTSILQSLGLTAPSISYLVSGVYGLVKFVTVIIYCIFIIDRLGRRQGLFAGSILIIIALTYITTYLAVAHPAERTSTGAAGWVAVVMIYIFAIGYAMSWGTIPWIINAEVFPNRVRSTCMSICITWTWLVNFALTRAQPNMILAMHAWGPFLLFLCVITTITIYCYFAYPETKGLSMERMDELFEMPWYKVGRTSVKFIANEAREEMRESEKAQKRTYAEHIE
ncbi:hypothetical protein G7054_g4442 [Neopestalotiopsis clavispora]|nr:hypothetical protein G7054_g4442 [Neopestalotiopsis clavispora]